MLKTVSIALVAVAIAFGAATADAKKFGGGKSIGAQRAAPSSPSASPTAAPSTPSSAATAAAAPAAGAAAAAAKPSLMSRMAGPLAGIAAGIGLGYLFSKMGAGGFLGILLIVGLVIVAMIVFGRMMMKKPLTATGAASPLGATPQAEPMQYSGNAAAAGAAAAPAMAGGLAGGFGIPAGFDKSGFEDNAKKQFMTLQSANDKGDLDAVRDFATDEFYNQIAKDVVGGNKDATMVDDLHAELLGIETERGQYWASVEFTGKMREDGMVMASPFREIWNLMKPVDGSKGWLLAGIQQA